MIGEVTGVPMGVFPRQPSKRTGPSASAQLSIAANSDFARPFGRLRKALG